MLASCCRMPGTAAPLGIIGASCQLAGIMVSFVDDSPCSNLGYAGEVGLFLQPPKVGTDFVTTGYRIFVRILMATPALGARFACTPRGPERQIVLAIVEIPLAVSWGKPTV